MLKQLILGVMLVFGLVNISWADLGLPEKVVVMGQELHLKEQKGDVQQGFIAEYISLESTWDDWKTLFSIRFTPGKDLSAETSARATLNNVLKRRQAGDVVANGIVFKNKNGAFMADFLLSGDRKEFFEHNVWSFSKESKGIIAYQIARRVYHRKDSKELITSFIKKIPVVRGHILNELDTLTAAVKLPFSIK